MPFYIKIWLGYTSDNGIDMYKAEFNAGEFPLPEKLKQ
jgi:hypothetical protein